jgi:DNA-3-methyladenine glycosylase II
MQHIVSTAPTFVLARSIDFLTTFPPCQGDFVLGPGSVAGTFAIDGRAVVYTATQPAAGQLAIDTDDGAAVPMVVAMLGARDRLDGFYAKAAGDVAAFRAIVRARRGLHHVRFRTLAEVTVHAVLGQRTPVALASAQKRKVAAALGPKARLGTKVIHAFPAFDRLVELDERAWQAIVGNAAKAGRLPGVVRGVAALGETWLLTAPYADADAALRAIDGIGPFSAAMILLRGLGRMDDVPLDVPGIAKVAAHVYGDTWDPAAIRARYGTDLGYWSFYLKVGATRGLRARLAS